MNNVRFVFSEEEDLASGPGTRLDHSELLCGRSFITVKRTGKAYEIDREETESAPLTSLIKHYIFLPDPLPQRTS